MRLCHLVFVQNYAYFATASTDDVDCGYIGNFFDLTRQRLAELFQIVVIVLFAPQRDSQHRHIVNGACFYQRHHHALRHAIHILHQLIVEFYK